jgi:ubiquinone biosynthesis protein COQ9
MTDEEFDAALIRAAFELGAEAGWGQVTAGAAARHGALDLRRARARFSSRDAVLAGFGRLADAHALNHALQEGSTKDRLFDILLRRFDFLQMHRRGVAALMRSLPLDPLVGAWLTGETLKSMGWMLEGAGVASAGLRGEIAKRGLAAVWAWGMRAWLRDESEDLSATMAAVDVALARAEQIASRFSNDGFVAETETPYTEPSDLEGSIHPVDLPLTVANDPPPEII